MNLPLTIPDDQGRGVCPLGSRRLSFYLRGEDDVVTRINVPDVEGPNGKA